MKVKLPCTYYEHESCTKIPSASSAETQDYISLTGIMIFLPLGVFTEA